MPREGGQEARGIGVVAVQRAVGAENDRVHGLQQPGGVGEGALGGEKAVGRLLVGNGDVEAAEFLFAQRFKRARNVAGPDIEQGIVRAHPEGLERGIVHERGKGMADGMAEEGERRGAGFLHGRKAWLISARRESEKRNQSAGRRMTTNSPLREWVA